MLHTKNY